MIEDYGEILLEDETAEPVTTVDLIEVLECVRDEITMAERIAKELRKGLTEDRLRRARQEIRTLIQNLDRRVHPR